MPDFYLPTGAFLLCRGLAAAQAADPAEWQNPQLVQQGQEVPRASFQLYERPTDRTIADLTWPASEVRLSGSFLECICWRAPPVITLATTYPIAWGCGARPTLPAPCSA